MRKKGQSNEIIWSKVGKIALRILAILLVLRLIVLIINRIMEGGPLEFHDVLDFAYIINILEITFTILASIFVGIAVHEMGHAVMGVLPRIQVL